ncbi:Crp/Fnr family transcriptional regulator [Wukongibacter sp. M2B1]|uniref:Crp/Fnr family transcriptional regulator n=1 Tax=Wukongibacter sp. M2B1 TaxID=3088895 RepID=UPI003D7A4792
MSFLSTKELNVVKNSPLFHNIEFEKSKEILSKINCVKKKYSRGNVLTDLHDSFNGIAIILKGEVTVYLLHHNGDSIPLRFAEPSNILGLSFFLHRGHTFSMHFLAEVPTTILLLTKQELLTLLSCQKILTNYLSYTNNRICFLIDQINLHNMSNNQQKICYYLLNECNKCASNQYHFTIPKSKICRFLGIGRSSFYRELQYLCDCNAIKVEDRNTLNVNKDRILKILQT